MRTKFANLIFYSIIAIHFAAAVIPIRNWPLTDYPMFSAVREKFDSVSKITFINFFGSREIEWSLQDYASIGFNPARLQKYAQTPRHPEIKEFLKERFRVGGDQSPKPDAVLIRSTTYYLKQSKLFQKIEDIEKIPYAELEK